MDHVNQLHLSFLHQRLTNGGGGEGEVRKEGGRGMKRGEGGRGGRKNNTREAEVGGRSITMMSDERLVTATAGVMLTHLSPVRTLTSRLVVAVHTAKFCCL